MGAISNEEIAAFVEENIQVFHERQLAALRKLQLRQVLQRKNPYLFKAKHLVVAGDLVKYLLDAFLVSREETNFGEFLEQLALFISGKVAGGKKSTHVGMDLEFERRGTYYIVSIKSGPNWGNSDQMNRMKQNFRNLQEQLIENNPDIRVIAVNGCCYGQDRQPEKDSYLKLCGQEFWSFLSENDNLYTDIIEPIGYKAREKNEAFMEEYGNIINRFTLEFAAQFCDSNGAIRWDDLVKISSQSTSRSGAT